MQRPHCKNTDSDIRMGSNMKEVFNDITFDCDIDCKVKLDSIRSVSGADIYSFSIDWDPDGVNADTALKFSLMEDSIGHMYYWNPDCGCNRNIPVGWIGGKKSMTAVSAPVSCVHDMNGTNRFTCAVSEVKEIVELKVATVKDRYFGMEIGIRLDQYAGHDHLDLEIYIDRSSIPMYRAIDRVRRWWEDGCDLKPMNVPDDAKDAMYSFWYSYQQDINQKYVMEEAERALQLGLKTIIIDDGWQMDGVGVRFAYTGDWEVSKSKFSDFKDMICKLHDMGIKVILWMGIPYLGVESEIWDTFKDKTLQFSDWARASVLDPRYLEIREYITEKVKKTVIDYDLDGLKLDFIDLFYAAKDSKYSEEMDFFSVQEATDKLMITIKEEVLKIKPDILIEFRQKYIGPNMRKYGNMFRVTDCPDAYLTNKVGVLDLRLLSGNTAVHSDMLIWNKNEKAETAALQIINVIFATMQYSGRLSELSEEHKRMSRFWIGFMIKNKELLQNAPIIVEEPQFMYTSARTEKDGRSVIAVYSNNKCVELNEKINETIVLNGTQKPELIVKIKKQGVYKITVRDCFGNIIKNESMELKAGITAFNVPVAGMVVVEV